MATDLPFSFAGSHLNLSDDLQSNSFYVADHWLADVIAITQIEDIQLERKSQAEAGKSVIEQFILCDPYGGSRCASHNVHNNDCDACGRSLHAKRTFHELCAFNPVLSARIREM